MSCKHWNNEWVAQLYDELESNEERRLVAHLESCAECRETLAGLRSSRELLQEAAPPIPATPRVVVRQSRWPWPSVRAFAAGVACATLVFSLGLFAGSGMLGRGETTARDVAQVPVTEAVLDAPLDEKLEALESDLFAMAQRVDQLEGDREIVSVALREELDNLERRLNRERVQDLKQVVDSFTAAAVRTGSWMDQTDDRLTLLALRQDPRLQPR